MPEVRRVYTLPWAGRPAEEKGEPFFLLLRGPDAKSVFERTSILPGQLFCRHDLRNPLTLNQLLRSGRARLAGKSQGRPPMPPVVKKWYEEILKAAWDRELAHLPYLSPEELRKVSRPTRILCGAPPSEGEAVFRTVKPVTSLAMGVVLAPETLFVASALSVVVKQAQEIIEAAVLAGKIQRVGAYGRMGKLVPLAEKDLEDVPEEPARVACDLRHVIGPLAIGLPVFQVQHAFGGFKSGDELTPGALMGSREEEVKRFRGLLQTGNIALLGMIDGRGPGLAPVEEEDGAWRWAQGPLRDRLSRPDGIPVEHGSHDGHRPAGPMQHLVRQQAVIK